MCICVIGDHIFFYPTPHTPKKQTNKQTTLSVRCTEGCTYCIPYHVYALTTHDQVEELTVHLLLVHTYLHTVPSTRLYTTSSTSTQ